MSEALVQYVVEDAPTSSPCDVAWLSSLLADLLDILGTDGVVGIVDGYHDCGELLENAQQGLERIKKLAGPPRTRSFVGLPIAPREPGLMYIRVPLDDPANRAAYVNFAPYSIHTTVEAGGSERFYNHDSGSTITVSLTDAEVERLAALPALSNSSARLTPFVRELGLLRRSWRRVFGR